MSNVICAYCGQPGELIINGMTYDHWFEFNPWKGLDSVVHMHVKHELSDHELRPDQFEDAIDQISSGGMRV